MSCPIFCFHESVHTPMTIFPTRTSLPVEFEILKGWGYVSFTFVSFKTACCSSSVEVLLNKLIKLFKIETVSGNQGCRGVLKGQETYQ